MLELGEVKARAVDLSWVSGVSRTINGTLIIKEEAEGLPSLEGFAYHSAPEDSSSVFFFFCGCQTFTGLSITL